MICAWAMLCSLQIKSLCYRWNNISAGTPGTWIWVTWKKQALLFFTLERIWWKHQSSSSKFNIFAVFVFNRTLVSADFRDNEKSFTHFFLSKTTHTQISHEYQPKTQLIGRIWKLLMSTRWAIHAHQNSILGTCHYILLNLFGIHCDA